MTAPLVYLFWHTWRNRLTSRLKRLREPKYLVGGIVGGLYFYFYFFRHFLGSGPRGRPGLGPEVGFAMDIEGFGALAMLIIVAGSWFLPHSRAALTFSEAEIAFLFPAPVTRRTLIHFKLFRVQFRILFSTFILTLVTRRFGGFAFTHAVGWWLILSTLDLHFLGCSFARTRLLDRGVTNWRRRLLVLGLLGMVVGGTAVWGWRSLPVGELASGSGVEPYARYLQSWMAVPPLNGVLLPFRWMARPFLTESAGAFFWALGPAVLILLLHYTWVVRSNVAFEEASLEASRKLAERVAAVKSGKLHVMGGKAKRRSSLFELASTGPLPTAFFWKNLISAGQGFSPRIWIVIIAVTVGVSAGIGRSGLGSGWLSFAAVLCGILGGWSVLMGPQLMRQDLRQDLPLMDVLKLYPVPGWQVVLGELLAPLAIITVFQYVMVAVLCGVLPATGATRGWAVSLPAVALATALVLPFLNLLMLQILNGAVLLFPAWFQSGREAPQGIEATGQRILFLLGQMLALAVGLVPAAIVFAALFFIVRLTGMASLAVVAGGCGAALALAGEAALGVFLLGKMYDRFDLAAELPAGG